jgi:hypothetical protein
VNTNSPERIDIALDVDSRAEQLGNTDQDLLRL